MLCALASSVKKSQWAHQATLSNESKRSGVCWFFNSHVVLHPHHTNTPEPLFFQTERQRPPSKTDGLAELEALEPLQVGHV